VGYFYANTKGTSSNGFMLDPYGVVTIIDVPNSKGSAAEGINSQGLICGYYLAGGGKLLRGFLYQPAK
jgi:hypothetical protein